MTDSTVRNRREYLRGVAAALAGAVAGCSGPEKSGDEAPGNPAVAGAEGDTTGPRCAGGFGIVERRARIQTGTVPEVAFRLRNAGDEPVGYELVVEFRQGTSLGIAARTGRDELSGTVPPDETVTVTATDDAYEVENTDSYEFELSLSCPSG